MRRRLNDWAARHQPGSGFIGTVGGGIMGYHLNQKPSGAILGAAAGLAFSTKKGRQLMKRGAMKGVEMARKGLRKLIK